MKILLLFAGIPAMALAQAGSSPQTGTLPAASPLWIKTDHRLRPRVGDPVAAHLVYPAYGDNVLLLPAGTPVRGTITAFRSDRERRLSARLRGDLTPFSKPVVTFRELQVADGSWIALSATPAEDGAPLVELTPPARPSGGFVRRQWNQAIAMAKDRLSLVTAPGKKDRVVDLFYSQLPYHPQNVQADTVWSVETNSPIALPVPANSQATQSTSSSQGAPPGDQVWKIQAALTETLSSRHTTAGDPVRAVVLEPVRGSDGEVKVPQGAVLEGKVTEARPARRLGRGGRLRFDFLQLRFPDTAKSQPVQSTITQLDATTDTGLTLDREGKVEPKPKDKFVVPLVLLALASRPLDRDRGGDQFGKNAVASNSLGFAGFIVGTAGGWSNVAAGIGYYGTAVSLWHRWIQRGDETVFQKNTRFILETSARRSTSLPTAKSEPR